jgi:hypothetical protein
MCAPQTQVLLLCSGIGSIFDLAADTLTRIDTQATAPVRRVTA